MTVINSWTRHTPAPKPGLPDTVITADCAHCPQRIVKLYRGQHVRWVHRHEEDGPSGFDAVMSKDLYESLDAVWYGLDQNGMSEMMGALGTICGWSHNPEMWNTIRRWVDTKTEES